MATYTTKQVRNVALLGHGGSGKTSLAEAMLYMAKATTRLGKPSDGNTVCDFDPEEKKRQFSINLTLANFDWKGVKINLIDTPGFLDFEGEVQAALRVCGSALFTVDAKAGVEVGTEIAWERAVRAGVPKAIFINKYDDPEANYGRVIAQLKEKFGTSICPMLIPAEKGALINLIELKKYTYDTVGKRTEVDADPDAVAEYRDQFFEAVAMVSDELMMKYFDGEEITKEEAVEALQNGIISGTITPVYCGSATQLWGVVALMDSMVDSFPYPDKKKVEKILRDSEYTTMPIEREGTPSIFAFKTVYDQTGKWTYFKVMSGELSAGSTLKNMRSGTSEKFSKLYIVRGKDKTEVDALCCGDIGAVQKLSDTEANDTLSAVEVDFRFTRIHYIEPYYTMAIVPAERGGEDKLAQGLARLCEEDKTLKFETNAETKQMLLSGLGDMQLDVVLSRLKENYRVIAKYETPRIAYRETIRKSVQVQGKHKKQSGGHGQYGDVKITFSPGEAEGLTFTTSVVGGAVPKNYFPAVEKGLQEAMQKGVLAGYPVVNLAADLYDGSYHDVDSNELSFKMAASIAYKEGLPKANPVLLEPVGTLLVTVPESASGAIMGDLNGKRRGAVLGMNPSETRPGYTVIEAEVPKGEMADYTISLRAMTQGKGSFTYNVTRYDEVPGNIAQKIIADAKAAQEE